LAIGPSSKATFDQAGFLDVAVEAVSVVRRFASLAEGMQTCRDSLPEVAQLMADLSTAEREAVWTEIEDSMRQFDGADGFLVPQTYLIGVGTK
jgi:hypothetical protein